MVQKIITAFRAKHKFNLSNERLTAWATKQADKIENEDAISEFIETADVDYLVEIAKLDDALRAPKPKTEEEPKPKEDEPIDYQKQIDELKALMDSKNKSDLGKTRLEQLKDLPETLKESLKFVNVTDMSDEDFTAFQATMQTQADALNLSSSTHKPFGNGGKTTTTITDEKAKEIVNLI